MEAKVRTNQTEGTKCEEAHLLSPWFNILNVVNLFVVPWYVLSCSMLINSAYSNATMGSSAVTADVISSWRSVSAVDIGSTTKINASPSSLAREADAEVDDTACSKVLGGPLRSCPTSASESREASVKGNQLTAVSEDAVDAFISNSGTLGTRASSEHKTTTVSPRNVELNILSHFTRIYRTHRQGTAAALQKQQNSALAAVWSEDNYSLEGWFR